MNENERQDADDRRIQQRDASHMGAQRIKQLELNTQQDDILGKQRDELADMLKAASQPPQPSLHIEPNAVFQHPGDPMPPGGIPPDPGDLVKLPMGPPPRVRPIQIRPDWVGNPSGDTAGPPNIDRPIDRDSLHRELDSREGKSDGDVSIGNLNSDKKGSGARRNGGKAALSLIPLHLLAGTARVLMGGKIKYRPWNWAKGMAWSSAFDCTLRHLFKWFYLGEDIDPESGEHHLDHVMANVLMLRHFVNSHPDGDDRPPANAFFTDSIDDFNQLFDEAAYRDRNGHGEAK